MSKTSAHGHMKHRHTRTRLIRVVGVQYRAQNQDQTSSAIMHVQNEHSWTLRCTRTRLKRLHAHPLRLSIEGVQSTVAD
eukprot:1158053-Pelagomonas_calceolata.AAC.3